MTEISKHSPGKFRKEFVRNQNRFLIFLVLFCYSSSFASTRCKDILGAYMKDFDFGSIEKPTVTNFDKKKLFFENRVAFNESVIILSLKAESLNDIINQIVITETIERPAYPSESGKFEKSKLIKKIVLDSNCAASKISVISKTNFDPTIPKVGSSVSSESVSTDFVIDYEVEPAICRTQNELKLNTKQELMHKKNFSIGAKRGLCNELKEKSIFSPPATRDNEGKKSPGAKT